MIEDFSGISNTRSKKRFLVSDFGRFLYAFRFMYYSFHVSVRRYLINLTSKYDLLFIYLPPT